MKTEIQKSSKKHKLVGKNQENQRKKPEKNRREKQKKHRCPS
jgi:hypothetical protein